MNITCKKPREDLIFFKEYERSKQLNNQENFNDHLYSTQHITYFDSHSQKQILILLEFIRPIGLYDGLGTINRHIKNFTEIQLIEISKNIQLKNHKNFWITRIKIQYIFAQLFAFMEKVNVETTEDILQCLETNSPVNDLEEILPLLSDIKAVINDPTRKNKRYQFIRKKENDAIEMIMSTFEILNTLVQNHPIETFHLLNKKIRVLTPFEKIIPFDKVFLIAFIRKLFVDLDHDFSDEQLEVVNKDKFLKNETFIIRAKIKNFSARFEDALLNPSLLKEFIHTFHLFITDEIALKKEKCPPLNNYLIESSIIHTMQSTKQAVLDLQLNEIMHCLSTEEIVECLQDLANTLLLIEHTFFVIQDFKYQSFKDAIIIGFKTQNVSNTIVSTITSYLDIIEELIVKFAKTDSFSCKCIRQRIDQLIQQTQFDSREIRLILTFIQTFFDNQISIFTRIAYHLEIIMLTQEDKLISTKNTQKFLQFCMHILYFPILDLQHSKDRFYLKNVFEKDPSISIDHSSTFSKPIRKKNKNKQRKIKKTKPPQQSIATPILAEIKETEKSSSKTNHFDQLYENGEIDYFQTPEAIVEYIDTLKNEPLSFLPLQTDSNKLIVSSTDSHELSCMDSSEKFNNDPIRRQTQTKSLEKVKKSHQKTRLVNPSSVPNLLSSKTDKECSSSTLDSSNSIQDTNEDNNLDLKALSKITKSRKLIQAFNKMGLRMSRTRGSHAQFKRVDSTGKLKGGFPVLLNKSNLKKKTAKGMVKMAKERMHDKKQLG